MSRVSIPDCVLDYTLTDLTLPWVSDVATIVLHHGLGACQDIWTEWLPALVDRYRVLRFDMRGHGRSSQPSPGVHLDMERLTDDLFAVMDAAGIARAHLVGESIGGTIVLNAALRAPERVARLAISNGTHLGASIDAARDWKDIMDTHGVAGWSAHMMKRRFFDDELSAPAWRWYEAQQGRASPDVLLQALEALVATDLTGQLGEISSPVLLIHPDSSPFIPVATMADLKNGLPNARLHVIGDAKHGLPFSHARECASILRRFLDEGEGGAAGS
jgi:pimeloyl-ACP methyl ester carboxylesterase